MIGGTIAHGSLGLSTMVSTPPAGSVCDNSSSCPVAGFQASSVSKRVGRDPASPDPCLHDGAVRGERHRCQPKCRPHQRLRPA